MKVNFEKKAFTQRNKKRWHRLDVAAQTFSKKNCGWRLVPCSELKNECFENPSGSKSHVDWKISAWWPLAWTFIPTFSYIRSVRFSVCLRREIDLDKIERDGGVACFPLRASCREELLLLFIKRERLKTSNVWPCVFFELLLGDWTGSDWEILFCVVLLLRWGIDRPSSISLRESWLAWWGLRTLECVDELEVEEDSEDSGEVAELGEQEAVKVFFPVPGRQSSVLPWSMILTHHEIVTFSRIYGV